MKVGFYSPLPPARSGVADYAAALLPGLRRHGEVEVAPERCDVALYHIGNNQLHADIYRRSLWQPGVVVLHDAVLHHFLLGSLGRQEYIDEFALNYGEWSRGLAEELWRDRAASASEHRYFEYPLLRRVAESSRAVVVHNPAAARAVREHAPGTPVVEIPLLFMESPAPAEAEVLRFRQRIGLPAGGFVFGVFGFLRESKRLITVLEAFRDVHADRPETALLIAGPFHSTDLERAVRPLLGAPNVTCVPYLPVQEFRLAAAAVDACINLRYPAAGETSAITIQLMGQGKPVLLTDSEETSGFPETACLRIPPGLAEPDSLRSHMILLPSMTKAARAIGRCGARHIRALHQLEQVARQYWNTLCEFSG